MNNCKYCKADCAMRGEENLKECNGYIPMSNADRIRAMSDYELAQMLATGKWTFTCLKCVEFIDGECSMKCDERCIEWLQQPAE